MDYTAITAALGSVLGGLLIEHVSWRYAFLLNVPFALAVLFLTFKYVPESHGEHDSKRLDWLGAVFGSVTLGWNDARVIGPLALVTLTFAAFVMVEMRHPAPMLPLRLF